MDTRELKKHKQHVPPCDADSTEPCENCTDEKLVPSMNRCDALCTSGSKGRCKRPSKYNNGAWRVCYGHQKATRFRDVRESNDLSTDNNFYRIPKDMQDMIKGYAVPVMISRWRVSNANDLFIYIPLSTRSRRYDNTVEIRWGDGTKSVPRYTTDERLGHRYKVPGTYTIKITGKMIGFTFRKASFNVRKSILEIQQWGDVYLENDNGEQFAGCTNLTSVAKPRLKDVTNISNMFQEDNNFNGDISDWDTSNVENMSGMFRSTRAFNGDISRWKTSSVTDMSRMFQLSKCFNGDISRWDTENVTDMSGMFQEAVRFNGDISSWETGKVTDMSFMFNNAHRFNSDLSEWQTDNVQDMTSMFEGAYQFNSDISRWQTGKVFYILNMFYNALVFNGDISGWVMGQIDPRDIARMFTS